MEDDIFFCKICGKQLSTINEIGLKICDNCKNTKEKTANSEGFYCWACGKELHEKSEIAQGVCHNCKASINRKIGIPPVEH
jgi:predicted amidophosphoribosyltransferase